MLFLDSRRVKLYNTTALRVSVLHKLSVDHQFWIMEIVAIYIKIKPFINSYRTHVFYG